MASNTSQSNPSTHNTFKLGGDLNINRLGYGAMRLTGQPGNFGAYPEWEAGEQLLRRAVELGVNFIETWTISFCGINKVNSKFHCTA